MEKMSVQTNVLSKLIWLSCIRRQALIRRILETNWNNFLQICWFGLIWFKIFSFRSLTLIPETGNRCQLGQFKWNCYCVIFRFLTKCNNHVMKTVCGLGWNVSASFKFNIYWKCLRNLNIFKTKQKT